MATSFFPVGGMPTASSLAWKTSLRKSQDAVALQQIKERVALYLWLIVVISVRQSTVAAISGLHCRALVMVSSSAALTAWLQNSKKRAERSERLMYEQSHRDYLRLVICIIVCLSWAVNHYRDNAHFKAQRDKNARELKLANAAITDMRCVSVMLLRSMQNTRRS